MPFKVEVERLLTLTLALGNKWLSYILQDRVVFFRRINKRGYLLDSQRFKTGIQFKQIVFVEKSDQINQIINRKGHYIKIMYFVPDLSLLIMQTGFLIHLFKFKFVIR
jgi:hypothetical protein